MELSRMMGVSPWCWWADVTPRKHETVCVTRGAAVTGPPSVKYRGLFINDEDWGLQPWAAKHLDKDAFADANITCCYTDSYQRYRN